MHQRRVATNVSQQQQPPSCCPDVSGSSSTLSSSIPGGGISSALPLGGTTSTTTTRRGGKSSSTTIRKRRRKASTTGLFKKDGTLEDVVVVMIQIVCIALLMGCVIALLLKSSFSSSSASSSVESSSTSLLGRFLPSSLLGGGSDGGHRRRGKFKLVPLPPSKIYTIPNSMTHIGDKSDDYAILRKQFDSMDLSPVQQTYNFQSKPMIASSNHDDQVPYDIYNCPEEPPHGYPYHWSLTDVLQNWPSDDPIPPKNEEIYQGVCVFDYTKDYNKAVRYRKAEVPFVVRNDPQVVETASRWTYPGYMQSMLGKVMHRAEYSSNNHFMYWNPPPKHPHDEQHPGLGGKHGGGGPSPRWRNTIHAPEDWKEPTKMIRMTYDEWIDHANVTDDTQLGPDHPHWYFRLIGCGETGPEGQCDAGSSENLFDELPFFQPKPNLYIVDPHEQKGIHCRFGMKGVIAENHFDGSRNAIVVLGGERRYILSHPDQCQHLALYPKGHPSARHSAIDWSEPDLNEYPEFSLAKGNEVVLQAGDVLYLPTNWFHYIISLSLNYQCNTRSGVTPEYMPPIKACGF